MKKRKFADGGIYTAEMGQPPMEPDGGSVRPKPMMKKQEKKNMDNRKYTSDGKVVTVHGGVGGKKKMSAREFEEATFVPYKDAKGRRFENPPSGGSTYVGLGTPEYDGTRPAGGGRGLVNPDAEGMKRGGRVKKMASGGSVSSRGDGCAQRGKTRA